MEGQERTSSDVPNYKLSNFVEHSYQKTFVVDAKRDLVWQWLNRPETFTEGQLWPFRVEFISPDPKARANFREGVICTHYGPGMNFSGILTEIRPPEYRDLQYFYGSYAVSFRFIRPTRLQFWLVEENGGCAVTLRVDSFVRNGWNRIWTLAQRLFWNRFPKFMNRGLRALPESACVDSELAA